MPYKKVYHKLTCPKCGKEYQVLTQAYIRKQKDPVYGQYCAPCRAKILWEEMSDEQKKMMKEKAREGSKKVVITKEAKEARKEGVKKYWSSLSEEQRKKISEKRSNDRINSLSKLTDEQMKEIGRKISSSKLQRSASMTQEELIKRRESKQAERKAYWDSLSDEKKQIIIDQLRENNRKVIKEMSDEEREKRSVIMTNRNLEFWNNAPDDVRNERIMKLIHNGQIWKDNLTKEDRQRISKEKKEYWDKLSDEKKSELTRKMLLPSIGKNKFHQKFENIFSGSVLSNSYYLKPEVVMSCNSVVHSWDYGIYDKLTNELMMVVDLDGSYYHADNCDYDGLHSKEEYDECRINSLSDNVKYSIINEKVFTKSFNLMMKNLMLDYDEYINSIFMMCRTMPFPYPSYTDAELIRSYNNLVNMDCNDKYHQDISINTRIGDRIIQHFHHSIYCAYRFDLPSPYDAWHDDKLLKECIKNRVIYQSYLNPNKILQGFNVNKLAPKVSVFSAGRAKLLIHKYLNEFNEIFDPFSGFSGRLLGAISLGKRYVGSDLSDIHTRESNSIIDFLRSYKYNVDACVDRIDIFDSSNEEFECLFTCPPYGWTESWIDVSPKNYTCDDWITECITRFNCKKYLFVVNKTTIFTDNIVDIIFNKSHFGLNEEYVILINKDK